MESKVVVLKLISSAGGGGKTGNDILWILSSLNINGDDFVDDVIDDIEGVDDDVIEDVNNCCWGGGGDNIDDDNDDDDDELGIGGSGCEIDVLEDDIDEDADDDNIVDNWEDEENCCGCCCW